jgi:hypothetical protein
MTEYCHSGISESWRKLYDHYLANPRHLARGDEGILTRLCPLQEILFSANIQFDSCEDQPASEDVLSTCEGVGVHKTLFEFRNSIDTLTHVWI